MGLIQRLFGQRRPTVAAPSSLHTHSQISSGLSQQLAASQGTTRRELLRVVLRDTMQRQGIPPEWIGAELLTVTSRDGQRGVHWRLLLKHWDPRLLAHAVALQQALIKRVMTFDPVASTWLHGISWQFALDDESVCPALPHPGTWTSEPKAAPAAGPEPTAPAGLIEGPVHIAEKRDDAKADLDQLLAVRDADFARHSAGGQTWASTEPAKL